MPNQNTRVLIELNPASVSAPNRGKASLFRPSTNSEPWTVHCLCRGPRFYPPTYPPSWILNLQSISLLYFPLSVCREVLHLARCNINPHLSKYRPHLNLGIVFLTSGILVLFKRHVECLTFGLKTHSIDFSSARWGGQSWLDGNENPSCRSREIIIQPWLGEILSPWKW